MLRPRSETPAAPLANAPEKPCDSVPWPLAVMLWSTSWMLVKPDSLMSSAVMTCTGAGVSEFVRRMFVPVISTRWMSCVALPVSVSCANAPSDSNASVPPNAMRRHFANFVS